MNDKKNIEKKIANGWVVNQGIDRMMVDNG